MPNPFRVGHRHELSSPENLRALADRRRSQASRAIKLSNVSNMPPGASLHVAPSKLTPGQRAVYVLFIANVLAASAIGKPMAQKHGGRRGEAFGLLVPSHQPNPIVGARAANASHLERSDHWPQMAGNSRPGQGRSRRNVAENERRDTISPDMRSRIQQSFSSERNPLGDRIAEGIVVRLHGWPADRALQIVKLDSKGDWEPLRTYPAMGTGEPVRLYLRPDGVYIAIAEKGSPFGDGAQIAEPREGQHGDSFYIAVQHALFPDQREAMRIERWNENDIGVLRGKVHDFSNDPDNRADMDRLFTRADADPEWPAFLRKQLAAYRLPASSQTPPAVTAKPAVDAIPCRPAARTERLGPAHPDRSLTCHVYIHEDVPLGENRIVDRHLQWWLDEMRPLLPAGTGLLLKIIHHRPGITDMDYTAEAGNDALMMALSHRLDDEGERKHCPDEEHGYHLLLTGKNALPGIEGLSWYKVGIASIGERRIAGHELGHMFGATHDAAEVRFRNGWWQQSAMFNADPFSVFRANWLGYSDANRGNIKRTLAGLRR